MVRTNILGVLIARASGQSFGDFLRDRIFGPLQMDDTGFQVSVEKHGRLAVSYYKDHETGTFGVYDPAVDSQWGRPVPFHSGGGGLVSTADDYLAFCQMMLNKGTHRGECILSRSSVELMTSPQITPEQAAAQPIFLGEGHSWGFGMGIVTQRRDFPSAGAYGWTGGLGTLAFTDPQEGLIGILMTQRLMDSPQMPKVYTDFQTLAYQAMA